MYMISKTLKEMSDFNAILYNDGEMKIISIPNLTGNIICFAVSKNDTFCRISMTSPNYINAEGENLKLNKEDIDKLIFILNNSSTSNLFKKEYSVWELLISEQNEELRNEIDDWYIEYLEIPNYYELLNQ